MLQVQLKIKGGKHDGRHIPISTAKFLIGREQDCQLRPNSDLVSRHHCVLTVDPYSVRLRDLGSTNGTFVNGERVRGQLELQEGDEVLVGKLRFEMVIRQVADAAPPQTEEEETVAGVRAADEDTLSQQPAPAEPAPADPIPEELASTSVDDGSETTMFNMPAMPPQMPGMPYPQQMPGMYPQMPGYPMYGYPGAPMGYPPGAYPQQMGAYPQQQAAPGTAEVQEPDGGMPLRLPDPSETGAKEPQAPKAATGDSAEGQQEEKPSNSAADIIKQYMNRRPGS